MVGAQATLLLALAVATAAVLRRWPSSADRATSSPGSTSSGSTTPGSPAPQSEILLSFLLIGCGALAVLAVTVVGVGVFDRAARAAGLAVISLFGYLCYLTLAVLGCRWVARRR